MTMVRGASRLALTLTLVVAGLALSASPASAAPALVVSKTTGLLQWDTVTVTGSGFDPEEGVMITQCGAAVTATCAMTPRANHNAVNVAPEDDGTFTVTLRLDRTLGPPETQTATDCSDGACAVVALALPVGPGVELARTPIDFEPTGDAALTTGTTEITTTDAGPVSADVTVSGSGFLPWFLAIDWWWGTEESYRFDLVQDLGGPGAYLSVCPNEDVTPGYDACTRYLTSLHDSPGTPGHLTRHHWVERVAADGTVAEEERTWPRVWRLGDDRVDCAVEDCRFVLEQDPAIGEGVTVEWASEAAPWPSDLAFIENAYDAILGRAPLDDEIAYLRDALRERDLTARSFLTGLAASSDGRRVAELVRLYRAALDRRPDAAGLTYWAGQLAANGGNMSAIARAFGRTSEFRTSFGAGSNADAVVRAYDRTLGRFPSDGEQAYWVGRLEAGLARTHMIHLFSRTPEHVGREAARSQVTAVFHGLLGTVPNAEQWARMAADFEPDVPPDWPLPVDPLAWRADDVMLELLGSEALANAVD